MKPEAGQVFATAWLVLVFALTAPLCLLLGTMVFLVTFPFDPDRRALHALVSRWTFQYLRVWPLWRVRVVGRERLPQGACVIVANHQSATDVLAAMGLSTQFKFVSKASLFGLPVVGWMMRMMRYVRLERGSLSSTRQMMQTCRYWLRRGMPVLVFPEGTYHEDKELLRFRPGAFVLAIEEGVPVVPVAIRGTERLLRGDGPWMASRARVEVEVLQPFTPEALGDDPEAAAAKVRAALQAALG